ncbi:hypothetical protein BB559_002449 [Furculomyces boomerangus]|uniref:PH domain-containing protein n=1 Tax=Furculomyces boomerangus TaxID=61424 RepID=A0A2T9YVB8_9FUNG|nr:hypothetical protein BB559_004089 [Furculomyces boomerangus]PVU96290.1 hypothetical protein BB559_002449 [Furculomyces boomerangus]
MIKRDIVLVKYPYIPERSDELSLEIGDFLFVIERDDIYKDGWWKGQNINGEVGKFPKSYTSLAPRNFDISSYLYLKAKKKFQNKKKSEYLPSQNSNTMGYKKKMLSKENEKKEMDNQISKNQSFKVHSISTENLQSPCINGTESYTVGRSYIGKISEIDSCQKHESLKDKTFTSSRFGLGNNKLNKESVNTPRGTFEQKVNDVRKWNEYDSEKDKYSSSSKSSRKSDTNSSRSSIYRNFVTNRHQEIKDKDNIKRDYTKQTILSPKTSQYTVNSKGVRDIMNQRLEKNQRVYGDNEKTKKATENHKKPETHSYLQKKEFETSLKGSKIQNSIAHNIQKELSDKSASKHTTHQNKNIKLNKGNQRHIPIEDPTPTNKTFVKLPKKFHQNNHLPFPENVLKNDVNNNQVDIYSKKKESSLNVRKSPKKLHKTIKDNVSYTKGDRNIYERNSTRMVTQDSLKDIDRKLSEVIEVHNSQIFKDEQKNIKYSVLSLEKNKNLSPKKQIDLKIRSSGLKFQEDLKSESNVDKRQNVVFLKNKNPGNTFESYKNVPTKSFFYNKMISEETRVTKVAPCSVAISKSRSVGRCNNKTLTMLQKRKNPQSLWLFEKVKDLIKKTNMNPKILEKKLYPTNLSVKLGNNIFQGSSNNYMEKDNTFFRSNNEKIGSQEFSFNVYTRKISRENDISKKNSQRLSKNGNKKASTIIKRQDDQTKSIKTLEINQEIGTDTNKSSTIYQDKDSSTVNCIEELNNNNKNSYNQNITTGINQMHLNTKSSLIEFSGILETLDYMYPMSDFVNKKNEESNSVLENVSSSQGKGKLKVLKINNLGSSSMRNRGFRYSKVTDKSVNEHWKNKKRTPKSTQYSGFEISKSFQHSERPLFDLSLSFAEKNYLSYGTENIKNCNLLKDKSENSAGLKQLQENYHVSTENKGGSDTRVSFGSLTTDSKLESIKQDNKVVEEVVKEGWLEKRSDFFKGIWKNKYFKLTNTGVLYIYKNVLDKKPYLTLALEKYRVLTINSESMETPGIVLKPNTKKDYYKLFFKNGIHSKDNFKKIYLTHKLESEVYDWISSLRKATIRYRGVNVQSFVLRTIPLTDAAKLIRKKLYKSNTYALRSRRNLTESIFESIANLSKSVNRGLVEFTNSSSGDSGSREKAIMMSSFSPSSGFPFKKLKIPSNSNCIISPIRLTKVGSSENHDFRKLMASHKSGTPIIFF